MGKDSLLKSTSKKKITPRKKEADKKKTTEKKAAVATAKIARKPSAAKKPTQAKKAPAGKPAPKRSAPSRAKRTIKAAKASSPAVKAGAAAKKQVAPQKLILKKFETWKPKKMFSVPAAPQRLKAAEAPPFVAAESEQETQRIRALLFKKFDLSDMAAEPQGAMDTAPRTEPGPQTPPAADHPSPPVHARQPDPAAKITTLAITAFIVLMGMILAASFSNRANYYIEATGGAIEVWQGRFAPLGKEKIIVLPGAQSPEKIKRSYSKNETFSFVFSYYLDKADTLLEAPGMPDFEGIRLYLHMARSYAVSADLNRALLSRLNGIDLMTWLYKADVAAGKGTIDGYRTALGYLHKAAGLQLDAGQAELVNKKILSVRQLMADSKAKTTPPPPKPEPASKK